MPIAACSSVGDHSSAPQPGKALCYATQLKACPLPPLLHARRERLRVNPEESAVLLSEPTHNDRAGRERCVEALFETASCPALFLARAAVLASFAVGRQSSLVVDSGYRGITGACCGGHDVGQGGCWAWASWEVGWHSCLVASRQLLRHYK